MPNKSPWRRLAKEHDQRHGGAAEDQGQEDSSQVDGTERSGCLPQCQRAEQEARDGSGHRGTGRAVRRNEYKVHHDVLDERDQQNAMHETGAVMRCEDVTGDRVQAVTDHDEAEQAKREHCALVGGAVDDIDDRLGKQQKGDLTQQT